MQKCGIKAWGCELEAITKSKCRVSWEERSEMNLRVVELDIKYLDSLFLV